LIGDSKPSDLLRVALTSAEERNAEGIDVEGAERLGIVAHHLFSPKQTHGVFIRLARIDEKSIARAYRELKKQPAPMDEVEGEGVMKELQSL
jgi:hypothetical protein